MANEEQEEQHRQNLQTAQQNSKSWGVSDTAKNMSEAAKNPVGLLSQVSIFSDMPYVIAFGAAILKDALDLAFIGSLPGIGTVLTICASILIFFMMLLSGSGQKKKMAQGMIKRGLALLGGTTFEMIGFGINFFPMQTATVLIVYLMELADRKKATEEEEKEAQEAQRQQNNLIVFPGRQKSAESESDQSMRRAA